MTQPPIDLAGLFRELNHRFFDGKLPEYHIEFVPHSVLKSDSEETGGQHIGQERRILLAEALCQKPEEMRRMLIHEMVHGFTGDEHDERFFAKFVEIAQSGEAWAWEEARYYHPCRVKTMIHLWRRFNPVMKRKLDPRGTCPCFACQSWRDRGRPVAEDIEDWHPWAPEYAPRHLRQPLLNPSPD